MRKRIVFLFALLMMLAMCDRRDPTTEVLVLGAIARTTSAAGEALFQLTIKNTGGSAAGELRVKFRYHSDADRIQLIWEALWPRNGPAYLFAQDEDSLTFWSVRKSSEVRGNSGEIVWLNQNGSWGSYPFGGN